MKQRMAVPSAKPILVIMAHFFSRGDFMKKQFDEIDKDKDGFITEADLKECIKGHSVNACAITCFLKRYDSDGDKKISFEEYRNGLLTYLFQNLQDESSARSLFSLLDNDKSGKVNLPELRHFFESYVGQLPKEYISGFIEGIDQNKDGEISEEEFVTFVRKTWQNRCSCCSGTQQQFMPRKMR